LTFPLNPLFFRCSSCFSPLNHISRASRPPLSLFTVKQGAVFSWFFFLFPIDASYLAIDKARLPSFSLVLFSCVPLSIPRLFCEPFVGLKFFPLMQTFGMLCTEGLPFSFHLPLYQIVVAGPPSFSLPLAPVVRPYAFAPFPFSVATPFFTPANSPPLLLIGRNNTCSPPFCSCSFDGLCTTSCVLAGTFFFSSFFWKASLSLSVFAHIFFSLNLLSDSLISPFVQGRSWILRFFPCTLRFGLSLPSLHGARQSPV